MSELQVAILLLYGAFAAVLGWVAWRRDPRERPLALLVAGIALGDLLLHGLREAREWCGAHDLPWLRQALLPIADGIYLSWFGGYAVVAFRYRRGRWPQRIWRSVLLVWVLTACLLPLRVLVRDGLGWQGVDVRLIALHVAAFALVLVAAYHAVRMLQEEDIIPAHLVLVVALLLSLSQLGVIAIPARAHAIAYQGGLLAYLTVCLVAYQLRILRGRWPR